MVTSQSGPIVLALNQSANRPYLSGSGLARFRHHDDWAPHTPEDFVGSTTIVHGSTSVG